MSKERKIKIARIVAAIILFVITKILRLDSKVGFIVSLFAYLIVGYDVLINAMRTIFTSFSIDETVLMSIATIGAFIIKESSEAVFVMVFYQLGELFQDYSYDKSKDSISKLVDFKIEIANRVSGDKIEGVEPSKVNIGDIIVINPYEKIPLDGEIIEGSTTLNTSMITGESIPRFVTVGDTVMSGLINNDKVIKVKVTKTYDNSTASKIINLIETATDKKSKSENFIGSFAKVYTPIVCLIALFTFLIPVVYECLTMHVVSRVGDFAYRALTVLVVSCPCAILISVPLAFFSGLGALSRIGVLVKGSNYIEALSKIKGVAFDKTGTMTKGVFEVVGIHHCKIDESELLKYVAHIEFFSNHPIAKSIVKYYGKDINADDVKDLNEIGGRGLSGTVCGKKMLIGNDKLMTDNNIKYIKCRDVGTIVHVAIDGSYEGHILIDDVIKENAENAISELKKQKVKKCIMLTGDREEIAKFVAEKIDLDEYHAELLPEDKFKIVDELMKSIKLAFVGDGINDAPCITRADVGIAMGGTGADSAIDLADAIIMDDDIIKVPKAIKLSKMTMRVVYENIFMSVGVKVIVLILSMLGITNMWLAVFSDVGIMVIAVLNSIRILYSYKKL